MMRAPIFSCQIAPSALRAEMGTGGELTVKNVAVYFLQWNTSCVEVSEVESNVELGPEESLLFIKELMELSLSDLAKLFVVTRPTVYAWLNGKEPSKKDFIKIQYFQGIAKEIKRLKIDRIDVLIHRPIFGNKSFFDLIMNSQSSEQWRTPLSTLKKLSDKETERRNEKKGTGKQPRSASDVNDDYSTPIY